MVRIPSTKIGDILRDMGLLTTVDIARILIEQKRDNQPFGQIAINWKLADSDQICEAWARQLVASQRHVDLDQLGVDQQAVSLLTAEQAHRFRVQPIRCWGSHLVVALVTMPLDGQILEDIGQAARRRHVYPCYCSREQLDNYLSDNYPLPTESLSATMAT